MDLFCKLRGCSRVWFNVVCQVVVLVSVNGGLVSQQYIFNPNQPIEFLDCDVKYAGVCAVQIAMGLIDASIHAACDDLAATSTTVAGLNYLQSGLLGYLQPGRNIGTFVLNRLTGERLVDTWVRSAIGALLDNRTVYSVVSQPTLLSQFQAAVDAGGGWVPHQWRWSTDSVAVQVISYVKRCPVDTGHIIGTTIGREPLPADENSPDTFISMGALRNAQRLVGMSTTDLLAARTWTDVDRVIYDLAYTTKYKVNNKWYVFMGKVGDIDSTGLEAVGNSLGILVAHPISTLMRKNVSTWRKETGAPQGVCDLGEKLNIALCVAAVNGGQWADYIWGPLDGLYYKVSYTVGVWVGRQKYFVGTGFTLAAATAIPGPSCETCSALSNNGCASMNSLNLLSTALAMALTNKPEHDLWRYISHGYSDAYTNLMYNMNGAFFVFAFDYNGTCVADASEPNNIGKTLSQLAPPGISSTMLHSQFLAAADLGGMWVRYPWKASTKSYNKLAYITKIYKYAKQFYMGVAFADVTPPVDVHCSALYAEPCAEYSVHRVVGEANAALLGAASASETSAILQQIATKIPIGGFVVHPYDENFECPAALKSASAAQCPPAPTAAAKTLLMPLTKNNGGWALLESHTPGGHGIWAYVLPVNVRFANIILYSSVTNNRAPKCTGNCPSQSTCISGRCICVFGWEPSYTDTGTCGKLTVKSMTCVNRSLQLCTIAGMGISEGSDVCQSCTAGRYKPGTSMKELSPCFACPAGETSDNIGATACSACIVGKYSKHLASSSCTACPAGTYAPGIGRTSCIPCPPGSYSEQESSASCKDCSRGTYQADSFSSECHRCPGTKETTSNIGSTSITACVCEGSWYRRRGGKPGTECMSCPEGMTCDVGSAEDALLNATSQGLSKPLLNTGFWSSVAEPMVTFSCVDDTDDSPCGGGIPPGCKGGLVGTVCSQCPHGHKVGDAACDKCGGWEIVMVFFFFGFILSTPVGLMNKLVPHHTWRISAIQSVGMTCEVLIEFGQTMASVTALRITWPTLVAGGLEFFEGLPFKLYDFDPVSTFPCFHPKALECDFTTYLGKAVLIPGIAAYIGSMYPICSRLLPARWRWDFHTTVYVSLKFVNLVFISQVFISMMPFQCYSHPGGNPKTSIQSFAGTFCDTRDHVAMLSVGLMSSGFCVGFFAYLCWETWQIRKNVTHHRDLEALTLYIRRVTFILEDYKLETYYWNLVAKVLEFSIGGIVIALIPDSTRAQIYIYIFVFATFIMLWVTFTPFKIPLLNLAIAVIFGVLIFVLALAMARLPNATNFDIDFSTAFLSSVMCLEFFLFATLLMIGFATVYINGSRGKLFTISHMATIPSERKILELWEEARQWQASELRSPIRSWQSHELAEFALILLKFESSRIGRRSCQRVSFQRMDPMLNLTIRHINSVCKHWDMNAVDVTMSMSAKSELKFSSSGSFNQHLIQQDFAPEKEDLLEKIHGSSGNLNERLFQQEFDDEKEQLLERVAGSSGSLSERWFQKEFDQEKEELLERIDENAILASSNDSLVEEVLGTYIVQLNGGMAVHSTINWKFGEKVAELSCGTIVEVLEFGPFKDRVRARIASPAGWISIKNTNGSQEFAVEVLGTYIVQLNGGMAVHSTNNWKLGEKVAELSYGTIVQALEIGAFKDRVRARIAFPSGWISIKSTDGSQEFAVEASKSKEALEAKPVATSAKQIAKSETKNIKQAAKAKESSKLKPPKSEDAPLGSARRASKTKEASTPKSAASNEKQMAKTDAINTNQMDAPLGSARRASKTKEASTPKSPASNVKQRARPDAINTSQDAPLGSARRASKTKEASTPKSPASNAKQRARPDTINTNQDAPLGSARRASKMKEALTPNSAASKEKKMAKADAINTNQASTPQPVSPRSPRAKQWTKASKSRRDSTFKPVASNGKKFAKSVTTSTKQVVSASSPRPVPPLVPALAAAACSSSTVPTTASPQGVSNRAANLDAERRTRETSPMEASKSNPSPKSKSVTTNAKQMTKAESEYAKQALKSKDSPKSKSVTANAKQMAKPEAEKAKQASPRILIT